MKKLLFLFITLLFCAEVFGQGITLFGKTTVFPKTTLFPGTGGGGSTWSLIQFKFYDNNALGTGGTCATGAGTACTVNMSAPGAGHLLLAVLQTNGSSNVNLSSVTGGVGEATFTHCGGTNGCSFNSGGSALTLDASYVLSATGTETSLTCNAASSVGYRGCMVFEYAWSGASITFDTSNGAGSIASCTTCAGVPLTISGTDAVVQVINPFQCATAISGSYTNPVQFYDCGGQAGWINASGTLPTPNWTQSPSGTATIMAIAFQGH